MRLTGRVLKLLTKLCSSSIDLLLNKLLILFKHLHKIFFDERIFILLRKVRKLLVDFVFNLIAIKVMNTISRPKCSDRNICDLRADMKGKQKNTKDKNERKYPMHMLFHISHVGGKKTFHTVKSYLFVRMFSQFSL